MRAVNWPKIGFGVLNSSTCWNYFLALMSSVGLGLSRSKVFSQITLMGAIVSWPSSWLVCIPVVEPVDLVAFAYCVNLLSTLLLSEELVVVLFVFEDLLVRASCYLVDSFVCWDVFCFLWLRMRLSDVFCVGLVLCWSLGLDRNTPAKWLCLPQFLHLLPDIHFCSCAFD